MVVSRQLSIYLTLSPKTVRSNALSVGVYIVWENTPPYPSTQTHMYSSA